jgi:transposase
VSRVNPQSEWQHHHSLLDMSLAFIKAVMHHLPKAAITFSNFHLATHASHAVNKRRHLGQRTDPALKGLSWALLKITARHQARDRI